MTRERDAARRFPAPILVSLLLPALCSTTVNAQAPTPAHPEHHDHQHPSEDSSFVPDLPPITDEDRAAAFPDVLGHAVHDDVVNYLVLFDHLEWQSGGAASRFGWDNLGWVGKDRDRVWYRTEGEAEGGILRDAEAHLLYGRAIARWWDVVVGARHDFRPGPSRTWAAVGLQGLAPYWFEVEATAYVGESGRTHFRLETEYDLLLTNRLILQPLVEADIYGKADTERGIGAGLSSLETSFRLRYEFRREIAPYVGVAWSRKFHGTAELAEEAGESVSQTKVLVGLRMWF